MRNGRERTHYRHIRVKCATEGCTNKLAIDPTADRDEAVAAYEGWALVAGVFRCPLHAREDVLWLPERRTTDRYR